MTTFEDWLGQNHPDYDVTEGWKDSLALGVGGLVGASTLGLGGLAAYNHLKSPVKPGEPPTAITAKSSTDSGSGSRTGPSAAVRGRQKDGYWNNGLDQLFKFHSKHLIRQGATKVEYVQARAKDMPAAIALARAKAQQKLGDPDVEAHKFAILDQGMDDGDCVATAIFAVNRMATDYGR